MGASPSERSSVREMVEDLREQARSYSLEDISSGAWMAGFLTYALKDYSGRTNEETLRSRHPGLSIDEIAAKTIESTRRRAAIEGAVTATAHTTAVSITLGSGLSASPITLPLGLVAFATDMLFVTSLQLRLAYDMSLLYGRDIDLDDPEDVLDLIRVAFGIKEVDEQLLMEESFGRRMMGSLARGTAKVTRTVLTSVGKSVFRRAVIKFTVPAASIPLAAGMNYYFTGETGKQARQVFRDKTAIRRAALRLAKAGIADPRLIVETIWLMTHADKKIAAEESWLLESTLAAFSRLDEGELAAEALETLPDVTAEGLMRRLVWARYDLREAVFETACVTAVVDHKLSFRERRLLKRLARVCETKLDVVALKARARNKEVW